MAGNGRDTDNFFRDVAQKWAGPVKIWVFAIFLGFIIIGAVFFAEDTYSSYQGIIMIESKYNLRSVSWPITYWAASLVSQLGQMGFMYIYLTDRKKNFVYLIAAMACFVVDVSFDAFYRANGFLGNGERILALGINTLIFSAFAEVLITIGIGAALTLWPGAWAEIVKLFNSSGGGRGRSSSRGNSNRSNSNRGNSNRGGNSSQRPSGFPVRDNTSELESILNGR